MSEKQELSPATSHLLTEGVSSGPLKDTLSCACWQRISAQGHKKKGEGEDGRKDNIQQRRDGNVQGCKRILPSTIRTPF